MTECVPGCGDCCDPVVYQRSPDQIAAALADLDSPADRETLAFVAEHWHPIGPMDEQAPPASAGLDTSKQRAGVFWLYRCDQFDPGTRMCMAHEDRPPICRHFPWYGREPGSSPVELSPRCSFEADRRPMLPIVAVTAGSLKAGT